MNAFRLKVIKTRSTSCLDKYSTKREISKILQYKEGDRYSKGFEISLSLSFICKHVIFNNMQRCPFIRTFVSCILFYVLSK